MQNYSVVRRPPPRPFTIKFMGEWIGRETRMDDALYDRGSQQPDLVGSWPPKPLILSVVSWPAQRVDQQARFKFLKSSTPHGWAWT